MLFDSVHVFKCIYNNLINKKEFKCPNFNGLEVGAMLSHIEELYKLELGKPAKYAHKLSEKLILLIVYSMNLQLHLWNITLKEIILNGKNLQTY